MRLVVLLLAAALAACTPAADEDVVRSEGPRAVAPPPIPTAVPDELPARTAPPRTPLPATTPPDPWAPLRSPPETGPPPDLPLRAQVGDVRVTEPGTVLAGIDLEGCVHVRADDVVIRDSRIRCAGANGIRFYPDVRGGVVERVEVDGMAVADNGIKDGDGIVVRHVRIHGSADGIKVGSRATYEANHIHDLHFTEDSHNDGMQMMGGEEVVIRGNHIDNPGGTSALMIKTDRSAIHDVRIEGNALRGGAFTVYVVDAEKGHGPPTDVTIDGNLFGDEARFGLLRLHGDPVVVGNVDDRSGDAVEAPPERGA